MLKTSFIKKPYCSLGVVLCSLLWLSACSQSSFHAEQSPTSQGISHLQSYTNVVSIDASWAMTYSDVKSAKAASDVVVVGTITGSKAATQDSKGLVFTDFTLKVEQTIWDPKHEIKDANILIHQTGGIVNSTKHEIDDDPLFQVNEHTVLFLHIYQPGYAFVIGGPSGRFVVKNGQVEPKSKSSGMKDFVSRTISLADFITEVRNS